MSSRVYMEKQQKQTSTNIFRVTFHTYILPFVQQVVNEMKIYVLLDPFPSLLNNESVLILNLHRKIYFLMFNLKLFQRLLGENRRHWDSSDRLDYPSSQFIYDGRVV